MNEPARHCPAGHRLTGGSRPCAVCRVATIAAVVTAACPELTAGEVAAAIGAAITGGAAARDLAAALVDGPRVLTAGAPPVVARLVVELRSRGSVLPVPACAHCERTELTLIRDGTVGLCGRCRARQLAEACSACQKIRVVTARLADGSPLCFACAPRPERTCGRCGRMGPIARRATGAEPDICNSCFGPPVAVCSACGHTKPCYFAATPRPVCLSCSPRATPVCAHCGQRRPPCARWPEGPVCEPCYRAALSRRGTCQGCGQPRRLVSPPGVDARLCADCAGTPPLARCAQCGTEDRPYHRGRCVHCVLAERAAVLLAGPRPDLRSVYDAIVDARQPYSAHNWLRSAIGAKILGDIAASPAPLTHETLDAHPHPRAAGFLQQILVANDVLPARDDALVALEAWVADRLKEVEDPAHRRLLRSYATWRVLRRARTRAARVPRTRTAVRHAKMCLLAAIALLAWLDQQGVALGDLGQGDIDTWSAEGGGPAAHEATDFLDWATARQLIKPVDLAGRDRQAGVAMDAERRWAIVDRLLHDNTPRLTDRVAGCLVLLYAQQLTRILALTVNQVTAADDGVYLHLGTSQAVCPEPLGGLLRQLATGIRRPYNGVGSPAHAVWLFPGPTPRPTPPPRHPRPAPPTPRRSHHDRPAGRPDGPRRPSPRRRPRRAPPPPPHHRRPLGRRRWRRLEHLRRPNRPTTMIANYAEYSPPQLKTARHSTYFEHRSLSVCGPEPA